MAGAGYKLYSTGDVLTASDVNTYIQQQTVMVFADAATRTTALSGVVAEGMLTYLKDTDVVQYYSGSGWVTVNTDQTPLTTKGDLFTYSTQDARLAVGNNGETLVADSSTSTGLRYQETNAAGKNFVINGGFDIWQRATASTALPTTVGYSTADRWAVNQDAASAGTSSQATSSMPAGFRYAIQLQRNSSSTSTNPIRMYQILETQNSIPAQGKVLTFSFWAKAGANYSPTSSALNVRVSTGTGTDQAVTNLPNGALTGYAEVVSTSVTLTTSWQRFTLTSSTVSSSATQIGFGFFWNPTGTAGANDWVQITGVQLELGSVATTFQRAGGTLAGEFQACQRYYQILHGLTGNATLTTQIHAPVNFVVPMRTSPSVAGSAALYISDGTNDFTQSATNVAFVNGNRVTSQNCQLIMQNFTGLTQWRSYMLVSTQGGDIQFSAEL